MHPVAILSLRFVSVFQHIHLVPSHRFGSSTQECQRFKTQSVIHCRLLGSLGSILRRFPVSLGPENRFARQASDKSTVVRYRPSQRTKGPGYPTSRAAQIKLAAKRCLASKVIHQGCGAGAGAGHQRRRRTWDEAHSTLHEIGCV